MCPKNFATLLLLAVCLVAVCQAADITTQEDLQSCLDGSDPECIIPADTTIYANETFVITRSVVIRGSGNSIIDLNYMCPFLEDSTGSSAEVTITDLEVRNGVSNGIGDAAFWTLSDSAPFTLARLTVRNMISAGFAGALYGNVSTGSISQVTFINCTTLVDTSAGGDIVWIPLATALYLDNPQNVLLEDLTFINCTYPSYDYSILFIGAWVMDSQVTFKGDISFEGNNSYSTSAGAYFYTAQAYETQTHSVQLSIKTNASNPSHWYFSRTNYELMSFGTYNGGIDFSAGSMTHQNTSYNSTTIPLGALVTDGYTFITSIAFSGSLVVDKANVLSTVANQTFLSVGEDLNSTDCLSSSALGASKSTSISAKNIYISNYATQALIMSGWTSIHVDNNFIISRDLTRTFPQQDTAAISATFLLRPNMQNLPHSIYAGNQFNVTGHKTSNTGGSLQLNSRARITITTASFNMQQGQAVYGGAIYLASNAAFTLNATQNALFKGNRALTQGGAIMASASTSTVNFIGTGEIVFDSNVANQGGALAIFPGILSAFNTSSFNANSANDGCLLYMMNSVCSILTTSGNLTYNRQLQAAGSSTCPSTESQCDWTPPPVNPPPPVTPPVLPPVPQAPPTTPPTVVVEAPSVESPSLPPSPSPSVEPASPPSPYAEPTESPMEAPLMSPSPIHVAPQDPPEAPSPSPSPVVAVIPSPSSSPSPPSPSPPPSSPPSPVAALVCPGTQPTTSSTCEDIDGSSPKWHVPSGELSTQLGESFSIDSPIFIIGPFSTSGTITLRNALSFETVAIESDDCLQISTIDVQLTDDEVKHLEQSSEEISLTTSSCSSKAIVSVSGAKPSKKCKKIEAQSPPSSSSSDDESDSSNSLSTRLRINGSQCNLWWIILVSVLGSLAVIAAITAIAVVALKHMHKGKEEKFQQMDNFS